MSICGFLEEIRIYVCGNRKRVGSFRGGKGVVLYGGGILVGLCDYLNRGGGRFLEECFCV